MTSGHKDVVYKKIQGGTKHDITLRLSNKYPWEVAILTLHPWGHVEKKLPFKVETRLGSKDWVEYPTGCEIHAEEGPHTYTSVRAQFCKSYFRQRVQFSMEIDDKTGQTSVAIVVVKHKRRHTQNRSTCTSAFCKRFRYDNWPIIFPRDDEQRKCQLRQS